MTASEPLGLRPDLFEFAMFRIREMAEACQHRRPTFCEDDEYRRYLNGKCTELCAGLPYRQSLFYHAFRNYLDARLAVRRRRQTMALDPCTFTRMKYDSAIQWATKCKRTLRSAIVLMTEEVCPGVPARL